MRIVIFCGLNFSVSFLVFILGIEIKSELLGGWAHIVTVILYTLFGAAIMLLPPLEIGLIMRKLIEVIKSSCGPRKKTMLDKDGMKNG